MPLNSSATVYGGAGGRGSVASVCTPEGLRNMMKRNNLAPAPESQSYAPVTRGEPGTASAGPDDNKSTLRGLNDRLSSYLAKVQDLQQENADLRQKIDKFLKERKTPKGRDWDKAQNPLEELEEKIKNLTMENAKKLLEIDNNRLANDEFKTKLDDETKTRKEIEKDLDKMNTLINNIKLDKTNLQPEIKMVKDEINRLKADHKKEVDELLQEIKKSEVTVEVDSSTSNLAEIINSIRVQYQNVSERNLKDMEDWYNNKFQNIEVEEAQNTEVLDKESGELQELEKQLKTLQVQIKSQETTLSTLQETLNKTKWENNQRLAPLYRHITKLEANLREVRSQVEHQGEVNKNLLTVKMKLVKEIEAYRELMHSITAENESSRFDLEDGLQSDPPNINLHWGEEEVEELDSGEQEWAAVY